MSHQSLRTVEDRNALVVANLRLVDFCINKMHRGGDDAFVRKVGSRADLFQHGVIGLINAAELWDESQGIKFSTYAVWAIKRRLIKAMTEGGIVRTPYYHSRNAAYKKETMRVSEATLLAAEKARCVLHFSALSGVGEEQSPDEILNIVARAELPSMFDDADSRLAIEEALELLDERKRQIVRMFYFDGLRMLEIGRELGITRERVRQLRNKALKDLRGHLRGRDL